MPDAEPESGHERERSEHQNDKPCLAETERHGSRIKSGMTPVGVARWMHTFVIPDKEGEAGRRAGIRT